MFLKFSGVIYFCVFTILYNPTTYKELNCWLIWIILHDKKYSQAVFKILTKEFIKSAEKIIHHLHIPVKTLQSAFPKT